MIPLAIRLAVGGGREAFTRLALTAVGVAIGTALLLTALAAEPAIRAQQRRTAWQQTSADLTAREGAGDPLLWWLSDDAVAGRTITVLRVAATGPDAPVPLGIDPVPGPGEVHVSPALGTLLSSLPADRLADRFPSTPAGTISSAFLGGPEDLVAVIGATRAEMEALDAPAVHRISTRPASFQFTDLLRIALAIGAVGLLVPVGVFVATSTRIGAARREQRLAALRLAGATPRQTTLVAAVEAFASAGFGVALGVLGFALLRPVAARIELDGQRPFLEDLAVAPGLLAAVVVAVPAIAVAAAMVSLRRLQVSPLGVVRREPRPRPTARRLLPLAIGSASFSLALGTAMQGRGTPVLVLVMATFALMIHGIVVAGPWLTAVTARSLGRLARRAGLLLAGRRLEDDPNAGFRAVSGLVVAVFVASVFSGVTPALLAENRSAGDGMLPSSTLVARLPAGTSLEEAQQAVEAARTAGGGNAAMLHEDPDPRRPQADPERDRGHTVLVDCAHAADLDAQGTCPPGGTAWVDTGLDDGTFEPAPYQPADLATMPVEIVAVETDGTPPITDRVRTAILAEVPTAAPLLGHEANERANHRLVQLNRAANLALLLTLAIAGCSLAVSVAAGIIERTRPFALLRLAGMQLRELQRTALAEAAAPLLLIAGATAALGLVTSMAIVAITTEVAWVAPSIGYWLTLAGGLAAALGVAAATLPLLGRVTAPSTVRFE